MEKDLVGPTYLPESFNLSEETTDKEIMRFMDMGEKFIDGFENVLEEVIDEDGKSSLQDEPETNLSLSKTFSCCLTLRKSNI